LSVVVAENVRIAENAVAIGFSVYDLKGKKVADNNVPDAIFNNAGGY
jgi:hypothetical protein